MKSCVSVMNLITAVIKKFITEGVNSCHQKGPILGCAEGAARGKSAKGAARGISTTTSSESLRRLLPLHTMPPPAQSPGF